MREYGAASRSRVVSWRPVKSASNGSCVCWPASASEPYERSFAKPPDLRSWMNNQWNTAQVCFGILLNLESSSTSSMQY